ncbi:serine/arginine repetitive matrix protein 1-like [Panicum virgatum]|uniref:serine/arginine repetitive matrix protein 1-like n=1 Tax=Panicum virgatum TaxID=38727 RepID=UPI0019D54BB2|nr:serine/arginine repetitive matrix protein 1-like [Panicum virgatum]
MRPKKGYITLGLSHRGNISKPPTPEARKANHLHGEAVKKKKDATKEAATRKRERKEEHEKVCKIARMEGSPWPPMPESTEEKDSSSCGVDFSEPDDFEVVKSASPPPAHRGAGGEGSLMALGEARRWQGERRSPTPTMGQRSPVPAAGRRSPTPATGQRLPVPAVGRRLPTPATGQRLPSPATGRQTPAPAASSGGGGGGGVPRLQSNPRATPSGQSSGGVSVPRSRRSGTGKRSMGCLSENTTKRPAQLAPTKALKTGAHATPHLAPRPTSGGDQALEAVVAMPRRRPAGVVRRAARLDVEADEGGAGSAAQPEAGGEAGEEAQEHTAGQREGETLAPSPPRAVVEGATNVESAPRAPAVEETRVPEPTRAGDEDAAEAATTQTAPSNTAPVVELPLSSDEYGDSRDIDPATATSSTNRIFEFISASEEILGAGTSEGPGHGANYAIVQSEVPSRILRNKQEEEEAWKAQYDVGTQIQDALSRAFQLHQKMDFLISKWLREILHNKSAELARLYSQRALEEELAQTANERDVQMATVERKAREVEAQAAELQRKEAELQGKEAELQRKKATVATLSATLTERDATLAKQEAAARSAEAAVKEKEAFLSTLQEQANTVLARLEKAQGDITELRKAVADETAAKEAIQGVLTAAQDEYADLEQAVVAVCKELEGEGALFFR